ncbi:MAG: phenylalanine--tRNA ligase subunit alpha [Bacteroidales bacterium]|jgi:phenylalanyl-tRNA synthetase alpha chain|nr:phenylalanine--tRNA ligase subunit alpha [Bacteroidales bacterium]
MEINEQLKRIKEEIDTFFSVAADEVDKFRLKYLGKKGIITCMFDDIRTIAPEQRKEFGKNVNDLKTQALSKIEQLNQIIENNKVQSIDALDLSRPANSIALGSRHPIAKVTHNICQAFEKIGFTVAEGPEIEDDWHNFESLNFPPEHPARDMQDTFFISENPDIVLRTHTSSIQVRVMENNHPPIRVICPGRVFRNEAITARAHCIFHQIEGLYIDKNVSFADMKQTLLYFVKEMFGSHVSIRLRPSYFPFTEPSAEMDISCDICGGKGCNLCKYSGWVEILGCGMVDPNVLENMNINPDEYSGFAFGMGIERITQQIYKTKDIRLFFENDIRFLSQFKAI